MQRVKGVTVYHSSTMQGFYGGGTLSLAPNVSCLQLNHRGWTDSADGKGEHSYSRQLFQAHVFFRCLDFNQDIVVCHRSGVSIKSH